MRTPIFILFCEDPLAANRVEPDFEGEYLAATEAGFPTLLFNYDDLLSEDRQAFATKRIKLAEGNALVIYRGWMLTPDQYTLLYNTLLAKNYSLVNTAIEYQNCHYLPDSLHFIGGKTPATIYEPYSGENSIDTLVTKAKQFGDGPVMLKDYVKSEKHDWETACYVPDASNTVLLRTSIGNLIRLRGAYLNKGIVLREFIPLQPLTTHSKSGMPLMEEYRLFFLHNKLVAIYNYWEEGEYEITKPDTSEFELVALGVQSNFFSMDIARKVDGSFTIIELGDGQVAGLPDCADKEEFYRRLWQMLR